MSGESPRLDPAFLGKQKHRLKELRNEILSLERERGIEDASTNADVNDSAHEYEDDAQRLTTLELQGNLEAVNDERLADIERALQKIEDGTYGLSDRSGTPIPIDRLEASPEALFTLEEQSSRDGNR